MADSSGLVVVLYLVASAMLFFSAYSAAQRRVRAAPEFAFIMGASAIYALCYGLELSKATVEAMLSVIRFEYLGTAVIPAFWLLFALAFVRGKRPKPLPAALLFALPLLIILAVWTNGSHHLYYARSWARTDGPFPVFGFERGPLYWVTIAYYHSYLLVGNAMIVAFALRSPLFVRRQAFMAAFGSLGPWIGNVCYLLGWVPYGLDPAPFFLLFSGACFFLAIFRLGFFQIVPAARDRAIESLRDGFLVVDGRGVILDSNEAAARLLGGWASRLGEGLAAEGPGSAEVAAAIARGEAEFSLPAEGGGERRLVAQSFPVRVGRRSSKDGHGVMVRDITETAALLAELAELAGTDELTGLPNRRRFFEQAAREFSVAARGGLHLAAAILDIDHFKDVNDRYGHAAGDAALKAFASRLASALRSGDLLCRYGGEEFAVLLVGASPQAALAAVERLRLAAGEGFLGWEGSEIALRASAGVYSAVPTRDSRLDAFLQAADAALYVAKEGGRDRSALGS